MLTAFRSIQSRAFLRPAFHRNDKGRTFRMVHNQLYLHEASSEIHVVTMFNLQSYRCSTDEKFPYVTCGLRRPRSDCAFAQSEQGLCYPLKETHRLTFKCMAEMSRSWSDCEDAQINALEGVWIHFQGKQLYRNCFFFPLL